VNELTEAKNKSELTRVTNRWMRYAALSARPEMIWNNNSAAVSGIATNVIASITINSWRVERQAPQFRYTFRFTCPAFVCNCRW
jgi:hypothetical protein